MNVAVNSYNNALLTLLVSNNFIEVKSSVFKNYKEENLFQVTCSGTQLISRAHNNVKYHPSCHIVHYDSVNY